MKTNFEVLEVAETKLVHLMHKESPISYMKALENLCKSCGWTLQEYWAKSLAFIDAGWDNSSLAN
jgi:hypothetical protein